MITFITNFVNPVVNLNSVRYELNFPFNPFQIIGYRECRFDCIELVLKCTLLQETEPVFVKAAASAHLQMWVERERRLESRTAALFVHWFNIQAVHE